MIILLRKEGRILYFIATLDDIQKNKRLKKRATKHNNHKIKKYTRRYR